MDDRTKRIETLEEVVRGLESVRTGPATFGDLDFDDARLDGYLATALSAARAALAIAAGRDTPKERPR